jgi:hypothetical protein
MRLTAIRAPVFPPPTECYCGLLHLLDAHRRHYLTLWQCLRLTGTMTKSVYSVTSLGVSEATGMMMPGRDAVCARMCCCN